MKRFRVSLRVPIFYDYTYLEFDAKDEKEACDKAAEFFDGADLDNDPSISWERVENEWARYYADKEYEATDITSPLIQDYPKDDTPPVLGYDPGLQQYSIQELNQILAEIKQRIAAADPVK